MKEFTDGTLSSPFLGEQRAFLVSFRLSFTIGIVFIRRSPRREHCQNRRDEGHRSVVLGRSYNCTPVSAPALPSLARHPLWAAWEHTLELALAQLPALLAAHDDHYRHSPFFRDQLTAFQVWLDLGKCECRPAPAAPPPRRAATGG